LFGFKRLGDGNLFAYALGFFLLAVPLVTIVIYKNRKNQKQIIWLSILSAILFIVLLYLELEEYRAGNVNIGVPVSYKPAVIMPFVYILFFNNGLFNLMGLPSSL